MSQEVAPTGFPSGHVFRVERRRGPVWYVKYRRPDGRQVQRTLGPAWTERGRPAAGYFTRRTAQAALRGILGEARRQAEVAEGAKRPKVTFEKAAAEWLRFIEEDRELHGEGLPVGVQCLSAAGVR